MASSICRRMAGLAIGSSSRSSLSSRLSLIPSTSRCPFEVELPLQRGSILILRHHSVSSAPKASTLPATRGVFEQSSMRPTNAVATIIAHQRTSRSFTVSSSRALSSVAAVPARNSPENVNSASASESPILSDEDGQKFALFTYANRHQKLKPSIVRRRVEKLRIYEGKERGIRHSPWRMNLVCQFAAGQTVPEALNQLRYCEKSKAPLVAKAIRRTANLADIRDGLQPSQLEVAECFATHGSHLKRLKIMGRGRAGKKLRRFSHFRVVLREIDFPLKIVQAKNLNQKRRWLMKQRIARDDYERAMAERDELEQLEAEAAKLEADKKKDES